MMSEESAEIIRQTKNWVNSVVVGLNLCPFAKKVALEDRIRFVVSDAEKSEQLLDDLAAEALLLVNSDRASIETTLLIHPKTLRVFLDYNDFLDPAEALLIKNGYEGILQIASFHPNYQFGGTNPDDVENYTNRSPYPMLHLLREDSVTEVVEDEDFIDQIPERNIQLLRKMGIKAMRQMLKDVTK